MSITIPKAIEVIKFRVLAYRKTNFPDRVDALQLAIEALDYIRHEREMKPGVAYTVLKGEEDGQT